MATRVEFKNGEKNCKRMVWHPFSTSSETSLPIVKGKGAYLYSENGTPFLDAISSWWVNLHGHAHPHIAKKIAEQVYELEHVIFAGYTHPQAVKLAERLLDLFSNAYSRVFFSDNGSTAVEVALKMALQVIGNGKKLLSFQNGYHGDTFGAMAAGKSHYHRPFWPYLFEVHAIPPPSEGKEMVAWDAFKNTLETQEIGAFIFEPLIQGACGMVPHSEKVLKEMVKTCAKRGIITIADEVMTGFGRTGPLFASKTFADIICLSKGITGGFLPLGATLVKKSISDAFQNTPFLHGHSYTANPLACAAANGSLDLLLRPECETQRNMIENEHRNFAKGLNEAKFIRRDVVGTILAIEFEKLTKRKAIDFFRKKGIIIRPLGNVLYIIPPYCISKEDLHKIYTQIVEYSE